MDSRKCLENGANLQFPGMNCTIESLVGKGSNAIVYLASYPDQHQPGLYHLILVKELFPYHPGGAIYRDGRDDICCEADGEDTMRLHRISFVRGNEVHLRMQNSRPGDFDLNINTFSCHRTLYTVMGFSGGRSLEDELGRTGAVRLSLTESFRTVFPICLPQFCIFPHLRQYLQVALILLCMACRKCSHPLICFRIQRLP